ncbi:BgTH12-01648 [Blumeria graminis f. sp. triticale]|nr:BgTH12-01648 [Blumeria graminis f. sp. triticale]
MTCGWIYGARSSSGVKAKQTPLPHQTTALLERGTSVFKTDADKMRRSRGTAFRSNGAAIPDSLSLIRSFNLETNPTRPVRPSPLTASTIPDMPLDLVDRIRSFPLFLSAPDTFLTAIGKHLRPQVHPPHDHILAEGDEAKAMYWLVRGAVAVTSRDGEATYAELKPGAFFGEIGVIMDVPRTATIIARTKCLLLVLKKENLRAELPNFPDMERAIIEEAQERLTILNKKRMESGFGPKLVSTLPSRGVKTRESVPGEVSTGDIGVIEKGLVINTKKRKSPGPQAIEDPTAGSALGSGFVNIRRTLKELPLFSNLPPDILHLLGLSAQPKTYPPFTDILLQGSQGNEIYFIVRGEAEVLHENLNKINDNGSYLRPRLKKGQYFGEVTSLSLASKRTATVRAITTVECLIISGEVLEELWRRCPPDVRRQVEKTAISRIGRQDEDTFMSEAGPIETINVHSDQTKNTDCKSTLAEAAFIPWKPPSRHISSRADNVGAKEPAVEPFDPDPFLSVNIDNMKTRTRRGSWAPPTHESILTQIKPIMRSKSQNPTPIKPSHPSTPYCPKRPKTDQRLSHCGTLPDSILITIFSQLDIYQLMRLRLISSHWLNLITNSPLLCHNLDLSLFNRYVTNTVLIQSIIPFIGARVKRVDISNCYHITDEGFIALSARCGAEATVWKMKSVWDISANSILEMANNAKDLEEIDLSNCRKVSDNLLARIVGWIVFDSTPTPPSKSHSLEHATKASLTVQSSPVCTVFGCPKLKSLTLSYCKHVTDRSMAHLAVHAHSRLESIDLTRCTTITDAGFQHWSVYRFDKLRRLILADCTYLTDNAVVYLCNAARELRELDLSFCCALSDTATEVLSLGCPHLSRLKLSFCGSAVSDSSMRSIALHLLELKYLSVRGCVRVTGIGVEAIVEGCGMLELLDVSQCKNLQPWLDNGGEERAKSRWRSTGGGKPVFQTLKGNCSAKGDALSLR